MINEAVERERKVVLNIQVTLVVYGNESSWSLSPIDGERWRSVLSTNIAIIGNKCSGYYLIIIPKAYAIAEQRFCDLELALQSLSEMLS